MNDSTQHGSLLQRLLPVLFGASLTAVLFAMCFLIPPAGIILCLLVPFPAIYSRFRNGRGTEAAVVTIATLLVSWLFNPQTAMFYLIQFGIVSLVMPEMLARGYGGARTVVWATVACLLASLLLVTSLAFSEGQQVHAGVVALIKESFAKAVSYYEGRGFKGDDLATVRQALAVAADLLSRTYPAFATVFIALVAAFNALLAGRYCSRLAGTPLVGEFKEFKNPEQLIWLLIAAGFSMLSDVAVVTTPALNVLVVLGLLYFFQVLAVVQTMMDRNSQGRLLRTAFYLMLIFQPYVAIPVIALGIFDLWGDFRTPRKQENL